MGSIALFSLLILSIFSTLAQATVNVVRYPSGTPVQVCQASDSNPNCGAGAGSQTPWTSDINGGGYNLSNVGTITTTTAVSTPALSNLTTNGYVKTSGGNGTLGVQAVPIPVADGGTNATSASITSFNNTTGYTASGATGTTSTNLVFSTSPTITTPSFVTSATFTSTGNRLTVSVDGTNSTLAIGLGNNLVLTGPTTSSVIMGATATTISRNTADANPTLVINNANASATGNITNWSFNSGVVASMDTTGILRAASLANTTSANNARVNVLTTGTTISRNVADANQALIVNQSNSSSTGDIADFQFNSSNVATISKTGAIGAVSETLTTPGTSSTDVPTLSSTSTFTNKRITKKVVTASDATSITPNSDSADITYQANTQAVGTLTINADGGTPTNGQSWLLKIKSTNVQTFSWNAVFVGGTTALPTVSTGSSKIDYYAFIYDTVNSKWQFTGTAAGF